MVRAPSLRKLYLGMAALVITGCATRSSFDVLYEHYFPKRGDYVESSVYRPSFDRTLFGAPPPAPASERTRHLYHAFHGDAAAFNAFLNHPDREVDGAPGEEWGHECVLLLLRLGDDRFSELLTREDARTRQFVGYDVDPKIDWQRHHFPKTRALYSYRYVRRPTI